MNFTQYFFQIINGIKMKELTLEMVIEALMDFDITHLELKNFVPKTKSNPKQSRVYGLCYHESGFGGNIYLDDDRNLSARRRTIIHELTHAYLLREGIEHTEKEVMDVEKNTYKRIYKK